MNNFSHIQDIVRSWGDLSLMKEDQNMKKYLITDNINVFPLTMNYATA